MSDKSARKLIAEWSFTYWSKWWKIFLNHAHDL